MNIALQDWINFKDRLAALSKTAANKMADFISNNGGYANIDANIIIDYALALVNKYGDGAGALSALMYDAIAELSGKILPPAEIAEAPTVNEIAKAIQGAAKTSTEENYIGAVVGRLVKQIGADTTMQNALRDGAEFAWIPSGDTCAFCLTLASRGWQKASKNAIKNGHAEHIHANCDCTYAIRFNQETFVEGYEPEKYLDMYYSADGRTPNQKINAMRREFYAENKDKINAQKRSAYQKMMERNSSMAEEFDVS